MVRDYLIAIRSVQPAGPYRLVGWSAGGTIAHAIARRLIEEGERIDHLFLIDTGVDYSSIDNGFRDEVDEQLRELGVDNLTLDRYSSVRNAIFECAAEYRPSQLGISITLITASEEVRPDRSLGWKRIEPEYLRIFVSPGTHYTMVDEPNVRLVASILFRTLHGQLPRDIALEQLATSLVTGGADRRSGVARP